MTKTEIQKQLDENIPQNVVCTRSQAGRELSYLETWYAIDRMNQVFGQGNWSYSTVKLDKVFEGEVEQASGKVFATSYIATVGVYALIDGKPTQFTDVGYGDGTDKKNPGKAHELATKEAVSDGVKRAIKNFGRSMGLALYDKTQSFVGFLDMSKVTRAEVPGTGKTMDELRREGNHDKTQEYVGQTTSKVTVEPKTNNEVGKNTNAAGAAAKDLITSAFKVLEAQGKITKEKFKIDYTQGKGLSTLTPGQLAVIYDTMKHDFPTLSGNGAK